MRILLIENERSVVREIEAEFADHGYRVDVASTQDRGRRMVRSGAYDAILIGVRPAGRRGYGTCRRLRQQGVTTPIMLLAPPTSSARKAAGLEAGADDFLASPFGSAELLARVRSILRRGAPVSGAVLSYGGLELNLATHRASRAGRQVMLAPKELALLEYFLRNPERVLTREELATRVWGNRRMFESNTIEVYVSMLRRKIDRDRARSLIRTVIGFGYMLSHECEPRRVPRHGRVKTAAG